MTEEFLIGRIVLLGTGDPLNPERSQTSLALPQAGDETLLIDTTSGTALLRQLEHAGIALDGIRHLVVTHRHFDHAGGLAPLLVALVPRPAARLTIYAPPATTAALHSLLELTIPGVEGWMGARLCWRALAPGTTTAMGDTLVTPFAVEHGLECVGVRLEQGGRTAAFSADTRPCVDLVTYSRDADVLIHEAYGLAGEAARAHAFGHATAADAGVAARAAGVGRLVLTHFRSRREIDPEDLRAEAAAAFDGPVDLARDLDIVAF